MAWLKKAKDQLLVPLLSVVFALLVGAVFILLSGANPLEAYGQIIVGAFGSWAAFSEVLVKAAPLLLSGLSMGLVFATGTVALGAEGQILMGGIASAAVGVYGAGLPGPVLVPLTLLAGCAAGAAWAAIPGLMYAKRNVDIVVMTIMFNYIASYFLNYLIAGPFMDPDGTFPRSPLTAESSWLPRLSGRLHLGVVLAVVIMLVLYFVMEKTPTGIKIRLCGSNRVASRCSGLKVDRVIISAVIVSGALAGLAGAGEIGGLHHRLMTGFSSNYGWNAVAVALLGRTNPLGIGVAAFFWAVLIVGANSMQRALQIPTSLVTVIQAVAILFILASELAARKKIRLRLPLAKRPS